MKKTYDDIIDMPHNVSSTRPQMSAINRAAQFSPFAALSGYDSVIKETGRLTEKRVELDEDAIAALDMKLQILESADKDSHKITVTYYMADEKKKGGSYITAMGFLKKIDEYERELVFTNGEAIPINDIFQIECELFDSLI